MSLISVDLLRLGGGTQSRASLNDEVIADYADKYSRGIFLPDIILFYDGADHWLADGFHRVHGARQAGLKQINADVRQGTRRDAVLFSAGANAAHGLPRSNEDKRRAVSLLLNDEEWQRWSNSEIARRCGVSEGLVRGLRPHFVQNEVTERSYVTKHGTTATMQTGQIGGKNSEQPAAPEVAALKIGDTVQVGKSGRSGKVTALSSSGGTVWVDGKAETSSRLVKVDLELIAPPLAVGATVRTRTGHVGTVAALEANRFAVLEGGDSRRHYVETLTVVDEPVTQAADESELETVEASLQATHPPAPSVPEKSAPKAGSGDAVRDKLKAKGFSGVFKVIQHRDGTYTAGFDSSWKHSYPDVLRAANQYDEQLEEAGYEVLESGVDIEAALAIPGYGTPMVHFRVIPDSDEWYTPAEIIADARLVLGTIDLDPASCEYAQRTVQAATYYDRKVDGLKQLWFGKVWLNSPYSYPLVEQFILRLIDDYRYGRIDEAIVVVNSRTDAGWCQQLLDAANAVCFTKRRIAFIRYGEARPSNRQGQIFAYFGDAPDRFAQVFEKYGLCRELVRIEAEAQA